MGRKNLRTWVWPIAGLLALTAIVIVLWLQFPSQSAEAGQLSQADIESKAIAYAQANGFQGAPTSIESKQITLAEFDARLNPFSHDSTPGDTLFWIVILKGKAVIPLIPDMDGKPSYAQSDNMWVLLSLRGDKKALGAMRPGNEIDLSKPPTPITSFPTSAGPPKGSYTPPPRPTPTATQPIVTPVVVTPRPYP